MASQRAAEPDVATTPRRPAGSGPGTSAAPLVSDTLGKALTRIDRLDALTRELRAAGSRGRTSTWLAERLDVSARTVKRDVTALQQAGVPIRASSGPQGGYVIDPTAMRPPLALTVDEAVSVIVGLQAVLDQPYDQAGRSAIAKILRSMSSDQHGDVMRTASRVWIRPGEPLPAADSAVREVLTRAVRHHQVVIIDYEPGDGLATLTRPVEPMGFAHSRGLWFALTWCRERDAGRWFRLDAITAAQPTGETFPPRDVRDVFGGPRDGSSSAGEPTI